VQRRDAKEKGSERSCYPATLYTLTVHNHSDHKRRSPGDAGLRVRSSLIMCSMRSRSVAMSTTIFAMDLCAINNNNKKCRQYTRTSPIALCDATGCACWPSTNAQKAHIATGSNNNINGGEAKLKQSARTNGKEAAKGRHTRRRESRTVTRPSTSIDLLCAQAGEQGKQRHHRPRFTCGTTTTPSSSPTTMSFGLPTATAQHKQEVGITKA
jgi:hypothetical protein